MDPNDPQALYDERLAEMFEAIPNYDLSSDEATTAMKNIKIFSECRPPAPDPEPTPEPNTFRGKLAVRTARIWDNETTRVAIKAGGALAGTVAVIYATIHKDHVLERQAMGHATQKQ